MKPDHGQPMELEFVTEIMLGIIWKNDLVSSPKYSENSQNTLVQIKSS